jgi:hypothetical protein
VYLARGGTTRNPISTASALAGDAKVNRLVMNRMQIDRKARALIAVAGDEVEQAFLTTVFFGGGSGA